ncbi:mitochondrial carrier protein [Lichtheimia corymbifera JMRC:FSU:9682]|uniref:Mitochondrial carrier protein n=1 Tax=Lichtheimia corymbifera JMRC:FSU:9682 TaxID=1263082 RepID=A0A068RK67_9FUNG|nr:mitochondrial carrier protein [Lichtheimia corymbifera JMRC:FSU:9682]
MRSLGWVGGAAGIIVGSPLDVLKARLQAPRSTATMNNEAPPSAWQTLTRLVRYEGINSLFKGVLAPVVGLAGLNAILFVSYGSLLRVFERQHHQQEHQQQQHHHAGGGLTGEKEPFMPSLAQIYIAGCGAGIACFFFSTPTELVKIQAQVSRIPKSSWEVSKEIFARSGLRGFYQGGWITVIRDAPSYGIYFWVYEGMKRILELDQSQNSSDSSNAWKLLVAGGMAGAVSWSSIYPLDVIKSRLQMQVVSSSSSSSSSSSLPSAAANRAMPSIANVAESTIHQSRLVRQYHGSQATTQNGSVTQSTGSSINNTAQLSEAALLTGRSERPYTSIKDCIIRSYRAEGPSVFFRGLLPTIVRGFPVNAVTFYVYEVVMEMLSSRN